MSIPFLIKFPGFEKYAENSISDNSISDIPIFSSYENHTQVIYQNQNEYTFEVSPQRVWNGYEYGALTIPIFFTNDDLGWLRNLTIYYFWVISENATLEGDQDNIGNFRQSFGSPYVIITNAYWSCGTQLDVYLGITVEEISYVAGSLNHTLLCW